jgi:LytS/YehU family sensor histidine kinase
MRFEDLFQYEIEIDEKIDTEDVFLPSLILQPFVENAIRHGLRFKSGKGGKLWIRFYEKDHFLICEIEDNGIGRKKSAEIKSKQHIEYQSQGMMLSQNRLLLFNTAKLEKMKMEVVDLSDEKRQARGTLIRVSITLDF